MENNLGWIKIHRKIMENQDWFAEPFTRGQAWIDVLLLANHSTGFIRKRGILIEIKRGQVGYSEESLAMRWQWSRMKVRRFLTELKERGQITRKPAQIQQCGSFSENSKNNSAKTIQQNPRLSMLINIENYNLYQANDTTSDTTNDTTESHQTIQEQELKKKKKNIFIRPTIDEITTYCKERNNQVNPQAWLNHYESNGWMVGKNKMIDWKAAVRTWEQSNYSTNSMAVI
jgi:hypothetical protein